MNPPLYDDSGFLTEDEESLDRLPDEQPAPDLDPPQDAQPLADLEAPVIGAQPDGQDPPPPPPPPGSQTEPSISLARWRCASL